MINLIFRGLYRIERIAAKLQGKGYGATSIRNEYSSALRLLGKQPGLVVDVGANKGEFTAEVVLRSPSAQVHLFEPAAVNIEHLRKRFAEFCNVHINGNALSNVDEVQALYTNFPGSGLASLKKRRLEHFKINFDNHEIVRCEKFIKYWEGVLDCRSIDLVKIDVEGHELSVLQGFGRALSSVSLVQFEMGGCNIDTKTFLQDFWYFFGSDFRIYRISPIGLVPLFSYRETDEFFSTSNYIAVRK